MGRVRGAPRPGGGEVRVLHTIASTREPHGGTSRSVPALCEALAGVGVEVGFLTVEREEDPPGTTIVPGPPVGAEVVRVAGGPMAAWADGRAIGRAADRRVREERPDVVHDHGVWLPTNRAVSKVAERRGRVLVISPRGMLTRWSMGFNRGRKRLAWVLYQRRVLDRAAMLHVTSEPEAEDLRALGIETPVAVVPNGIDPPDPLPPRREDGPRRALFLSRLHPKKGLLDLVEAWARVEPDGWTLELAGPDEGGHRAEVERAVARHEVRATVRILGAVDDAGKWDLYREADLFVLPSYSENFGIVVAEALACEVPVVTTRETPWAELESAGCGWWVPTGAESLAAALEAATGASAEARAEMGRRGRALVLERYGWEKAARRMAAAYAWIAADGSRPDCVREVER